MKKGSNAGVRSVQRLPLDVDRISEMFHAKVLADPVLAPHFPKDTTRLARHFAAFLEEQFCGGFSYTATRGKQSLLCRHAHLSISTEESVRWLSHMESSLRQVGVTDADLGVLLDYFTTVAGTLTDPCIPQYKLSVAELHSWLHSQPEISFETGQRLMKEAVYRGDAERVQVLLDCGVSPNAEDRFEHGPLYWATNSYQSGSDTDRIKIVQSLLAAGAASNWSSGPGRSTPLHMTARRGHIGIAELLLEAGANIESCDSKGETPLRRAVNCGKAQMVELLLLRGANPQSKDKHGVTPIDAARTADIQKCFE